MNRINSICTTIIISSLICGQLATAGVPVEIKSLSGGPVSPETPAATSAPASVNEQLAQFQEELSRLKQKNEQQEQQIAALKEEMGKRGTAPPLKKLGTLFGNDRKPASTADEVAAAPVPASGLSAGGEEDKKAYIQAYEIFRAAGAEKATGPMRDFIMRYPNSPYMPNAHYWLGEFYLASNPPQFAKARQEFNLVYKLYPKTTKASAATYRLATMAEVDDNTKLATSLMEFILEHYPKSQEAGFAKNYLAQHGRLKQAGTSAPKNTAVRPAPKRDSLSKPVTPRPAVTPASAPAPVKTAAANPPVKKPLSPQDKAKIVNRPVSASGVSP